MMGNGSICSYIDDYHDCINYPFPHVVFLITMQCIYLSLNNNMHTKGDKKGR
jgi:hypothetical protein